MIIIRWVGGFGYGGGGFAVPNSSGHRFTEDDPDEVVVRKAQVKSKGWISAARGEDRRIESGPSGTEVGHDVRCINSRCRAVDLTGCQKR